MCFSEGVHWAGRRVLAHAMTLATTAAGTAQELRDWSAVVGVELDVEVARLMRKAADVIDNLGRRVVVLEEEG